MRGETAEGTYDLTIDTLENPRPATLRLGGQPRSPALKGLIATPIFALYPVAPPRLAGIGIEDVVSHQAAVALTGQSTMFYNPYAAVPSLHVGLAFAIGIAAAAATRVCSLSLWPSPSPER